jgi:hypothetical protein
MRLAQLRMHSLSEALALAVYHGGAIVPLIGRQRPDSDGRN